MSYLVLLGLLMGMRHALDADHVAAVASLATRSRSTKDTIRQGVVWGFGHSLTLLAVGAVVLAVDAAAPQRLAHWLELAVGVMLIALGADVLRRLIGERVHFHRHRHADGRVHFHAHSHRGEGDHDPDRHAHTHPGGFPLRAMVVGVVHGLAGSAALALLALGEAGSPGLGMLYVALFGAGSIVGMGALSAVMAVPLRWSARRLTWAHNGLQATAGVFTAGLGTFIVLQTGWAALA